MRGWAGMRVRSRVRELGSHTLQSMGKIKNKSIKLKKKNGEVSGGTRTFLLRHWSPVEIKDRNVGESRIRDQVSTHHLPEVQGHLSPVEQQCPEEQVAPGGLPGDSFHQSRGSLVWQHKRLQTGKVRWGLAPPQTLSDSVPTINPTPRSVAHPALWSHRLLAEPRPQVLSCPPAPNLLSYILSAVVAPASAPGGERRRARLPQQHAQHLPHLRKLWLLRGFKGWGFGACTVWHLVQKVVDKRVGGRCVVELGQAHWSQEMAQAEAMGDKQAHELRSVVQEGVHEGGLQVEGLVGVEWMGEELSTETGRRPGEVRG